MLNFVSICNLDPPIYKYRQIFFWSIKQKFTMEWVYSKSVIPLCKFWFHTIQACLRQYMYFSNFRTCLVASYHSQVSSSFSMLTCVSSALPILFFHIETSVTSLIRLILQFFLFRKVITIAFMNSAIFGWLSAWCKDQLLWLYHLDEVTPVEVWSASSPCLCYSVLEIPLRFGKEIWSFCCLKIHQIFLSFVLLFFNFICHSYVILQRIGGNCIWSLVYCMNKQRSTFILKILNTFLCISIVVASI